MVSAIFLCDKSNFETLILNDLFFRYKHKFHNKKLTYNTVLLLLEFFN